MLTTKNAKYIISTGHYTKSNVTTLFELYICADISGFFTETQSLKLEMQRVVVYEVTKFVFSLFFQRTRGRLSVF